MGEQVKVEWVQLLVRLRVTDCEAEAECDAVWHRDTEREEVWDRVADEGVTERGLRVADAATVPLSVWEGVPPAERVPEGVHVNVTVVQVGL